MSIVPAAVAERRKRWAFRVFAVVMCAVIYPVASFGAQLLGVVCVFTWVFLVSQLVWGLIKLVVGLRAARRMNTRASTLPSAAWRTSPRSPAGKTRPWSQRVLRRPLLFLWSR